MRNHIQLPKPSILYLLGLTWLDNQSKTYFSHVYVGNDARLSLDELEEVTHIWLRDGIEPRAKRVLGFEVVDVFRP